MNNEFNNKNEFENGNNTEQMVNSNIVCEEVVEDPNSKKSKKHVPHFMKVASTALVFGLVAGMAFQGFNYASDYVKAGDSKEETVKVEEESKINLAPVNTSDSALESTNDVSQIVENVMPSIVSITCKVTENVQDIFGRVYSNEATGSGSGIIIGQNDSEVLIVTNNHVVDGASTVTIVFDDENTAMATVKGTDSSNDLAVVAVKLDKLSQETRSSIRVAALGDSDSLKVGEMSIAIGNALGYGQSVTVGYISALNRQVFVEDSTMTLLQTDAAINPGNSGGALLNAKGEVIGINTVKYASSDVEGMGYAIPITQAVPIITDLMNREDIPEAEQAYLGIKGLDVAENYAQSYNIPKGVYVGEVTSGSPAEKAGLYVGSIITEYNGKDAGTMEKLQSFLSSTRAGETVELTIQVLDSGKYIEKKINVKLGSKADAAISNTPSNEEEQNIPNITIPFVR